MIEKKKQGMFYKEYVWRGVTIFFGLFVIALTMIIGAFLIYKGSDTFLKFGHTIWGSWVLPSGIRRTARKAADRPER